MKREIRFGIIGCGLMGREFATAAARWSHLDGFDVVPSIVAVCDSAPSAAEWFVRNIPSVKKSTSDYRDLIEDPAIEAIYCAVPHNLHEGIYRDIIRSGKHMLGEKPFGIDIQANRSIIAAVEENPEVLVRCSSEFPFYPGALQISHWIEEGRFGKIIDVEAGFWHSSDLDPQKPINWKRVVDTNGEYGCMGDLGMHVIHIPLRHGWKPKTVRALLANVVTERPDASGRLVACETWDNAILACDVQTASEQFPMVLSMKRIAPGHANTWFIRVQGTEFSAEFSTKYPKQVKFLPYSSGQQQAWHVLDVPHHSAYKTITGPIFEFGFSDAILQMWAAFCDELANGRENMRQAFHCVTPSETLESHELFTAALESHRTAQTMALPQRVLSRL